MRIVEVTKSFERGGLKFEAGHSYVLAEDAESQYRSVLGDAFGMSYPIEKVYRPYKGEDLENKRIMTFRTGGIGDMMFLSPVFRYLKKKYQNCFIRMASGCKGPLENLPEIDELYDMPFDARLLDDVDYHLMFQGIIESSSEKSKVTHAVDMFFSYFSMDSTQYDPADKKPRIVITDEENAWANEVLDKLGIKSEDYLIGLQMETSAPLRNYPKDKMKIVVDVLAKEENVKIFLIGAPPQAPLANFYKGNYENVIPAVNYSVRNSIVLASRYNQIIAPDTFMVQVAGALDKPLIGLYGPFASEVRMKYFKNAIGIEPKVACSPCYKHDFRACIKGYPSPCFSQVKPEDILQAVNYQRFKTEQKHFAFMQHFMRVPDLSEIEQYFLSADKGLCFFPGYFGHSNMIRVDRNHFVGADITDMSTEFKREFYPFVLYMNNFEQKDVPIYQGSKSMVRPGGYFAVYKAEAPEQFFNDIKRDIGQFFILMYSKYDPTNRSCIIVGKKRY